VAWGDRVLDERRISAIEAASPLTRPEANGAAVHSGKTVSGPNTAPRPTCSPGTATKKNHPRATPLSNHPPDRAATASTIWTPDLWRSHRANAPWLKSTSGSGRWAISGRATEACLYVSDVRKWEAIYQFRIPPRREQTRRFREERRITRMGFIAMTPAECGPGMEIGSPCRRGRPFRNTLSPPEGLTVSLRCRDRLSVVVLTQTSKWVYELSCHLMCVSERGPAHLPTPLEITARRHIPAA
jgi:hypothetical protein